MNKKNWLLIILACVVTFSTYSCKSKDNNDSDEVVEWTRATGFDGRARKGAVSFTVGNSAYVTTGVATENRVAVYKFDTYAYDSAKETWSKKADFPGVARDQAVAFTIGDFGYVGSGRDGTNTLSDFYRYDTKNDTWTQIASLPADAARFGAVGFAVKGIGYIATGSDHLNDDSNVKTIYKYDPNANTWTLVENIFRSPMRSAFAFVIDNVAYVGGGVYNGQYLEEFYKFDGTDWSVITDAPLNNKDKGYNLTRSNASTFVINGMGYVVGGIKGTPISTVWKFNPTTRAWTSDNQTFQGQPRQDAVGFSFGNAGYITTGQSGSNRFDDTWKFVPVK